MVEEIKQGELQADVFPELMKKKCQQIQEGQGTSAGPGWTWCPRHRLCMGNLAPSGPNVTANPCAGGMFVE